MLVLQNSKGELLLEKRPQTGIWGGLWSFPELSAGSDPSHFTVNRFGLDLVEQTLLDTVHHGFTHFELEIEPRLCRVEDLQNRIMDAAHYLWYNPERPQIIGLPAVISKMLTAIY